MAPGDTSTGIRVIDVSWNGVDGWIEVEGVPGRSYELDLAGALPAVVEGATLTQSSGMRATLRVSLPESPAPSIRTRIVLGSRH